VQENAVWDFLSSRNLPGGNQFHFSNIERTFIYLDDILLWGKTQEECLQTLHQTLAKLEEYHVTLNVERANSL